MTDVLFHLDHVTRTFGTGAQALVAVHDVSCQAEQGARIAVVGPSGSGKSTLIHLLSALDQPTEGTVRWPGLSPTPLTDPSVVGVVFQGPSLVPTLTALENVALPLVLRGLPHDFAHQEAMTRLSTLGLEPLANQLPAELSGGQEQRVAVARVLAMRPRLILADEPTGRLDSTSAQQVVTVLLDAADELSAGLVVATHDPFVADALATRWRMSDGTLTVLPSTEVGANR
jgi:putative ABC transport system ATP-binding protein